MHMHDGTIDFLKWCLWIGAIFVAVNWIAGIIGGSATLIVLGALVLVIIFAAGALFSHMSQKQTLDALTKFNAQDAQIDKYRQQSFRAMAQGESAMQRAAAQLTVLDAKRTHQIAQQQAKLLVDTERERWHLQQQAQQPVETWTWDSNDDGDNFAGWE